MNKEYVIKTLIKMGYLNSNGIAKPEYLDSGLLSYGEHITRKYDKIIITKYLKLPLDIKDRLMQYAEDWCSGKVSNRKPYKYRGDEKQNEEDNRKTSR